jgi:LDH2 family malate/lactate/ureidoglycolate dehydrogenase
MLEHVGVPKEDAKLGSDVLVAADTRGMDTHGVSNLLRMYLEKYRNGNINPVPKWRVIKESGSTATIDSDRGHGIMIAPKAMGIAMDKAAETGVGVVTINNARHLGMASYHAMLALDRDMIGMCMTSCPPSVVPTFGANPMLGTNPIAMAAPAGKEKPFVFDAATSVIPDNRVHIARRLGINLLPGWVADDQGYPVMEESAPMTSNKLLPLGSTADTGSYKGYGLASVVDIFSSMLAGMPFAAARDRGEFGHIVIAYNIEAFIEISKFKQLMDDFLRTLKGTPTSPGHDRVLVAGQLEWETSEKRRVEGIPLHKEVVSWFQSTLKEMELPSLIDG